MGKYNLPYVGQGSVYHPKTQGQQQTKTTGVPVHNTTTAPATRSLLTESMSCDTCTQNVLWKRTFVVGLMKPSFEEGENLSTKVKYFVFIETMRTYVQYYIQQQNEKYV